MQLLFGGCFLRGEVALQSTYVTPLCFVSGYGVSQEPARLEPFHIHLFGTFKKAGTVPSAGDATVIKPAADPAFVGPVGQQGGEQVKPLAMQGHED